MEFVALDTISEVGVALAGFAALASAIRGNVYDAEAIFGVVANGATALAFSLFALRFAGSAESIRILAGGLTLVALCLVVRGVQIYRVSPEKSVEKDLYVVETFRTRGVFF